jgi:hypothetical protein
VSIMICLDDEHIVLRLRWRYFKMLLNMDAGAVIKTHC